MVPRDTPTATHVHVHYGMDTGIHRRLHFTSQADMFGLHLQSSEMYDVGIVGTLNKIMGRRTGRETLFLGKQRVSTTTNPTPQPARGLFIIQHLHVGSGRAASVTKRVVIIHHTRLSGGRSATPRIPSCTTQSSDVVNYFVYTHTAVLYSCGEKSATRKV